MDWRDWDEPRRERSSERDFGAMREALAALRWRLIAVPLAVLFLIGAILMLATPKYRAEAQVFISAKSSPANFDSYAGERAAVKGQAQLVASRDLARRAIKELGMAAWPEFDPLAGGLGIVPRTLVFLGLMRDPARTSLDERILKSYEERLSVSAPPNARMVTIAFQSKDGDLAARAANKIADLYLEMRSAANLAGDGEPDARIVSRAMAPRLALFPEESMLLAFGAAAAFVTVFAAFGARAFQRAGASALVEAPVEQPRALGQMPVFARLEDEPKQDQQSPTFEAASRAEADQAEAVTEIAERILSARRAAAQGARIVVTSLSAAGAAPQTMRALGRLLGQEGRSIVIGLDKANAPDFWRRPADAPRPEAAFASGELTLSDLLTGRASFAEVIRRDPASRLHFVPAPAEAAIDLQEFAGVVETLARTYDFILLIAPPFDQDDMAKTLAAKADFVVLSAPPPRESAAGAARIELIECGAQEVLVIGLPAPSHLSLGQDAA
jgi:capsular polysaccharide biosynthesis protein